MTKPKHPSKAVHGPAPKLENIRAEFIEQVRIGNYIECAAAFVGLPKRTLYDWLMKGRRSPTVEPWGSFAREVLKAQAESESRDVLVILLASKRDWKAAAWRLERKNPKRWAQHINVDLRREIEEVLDTAEKVLPPEGYAKLLVGLAEREDAAEGDG